MQKFLKNLYYLDQMLINPCNFDHNGECLICDCWISECAWIRLHKEDYRWESKQELEEMFKEHNIESSNTTNNLDLGHYSQEV